jgi:type IV pilus assembly protein PilM
MLQRMWQKISGKYTSIGIEISDISIKLVSVVMRRGQLPRVQQVIVEPLPEQTVDDGKIKDPLKMIQLMQMMIAKLKKEPNYVHVAMPSQLIMVRFLRMPDVDENDIRRLVELEIKHNIHLPFSNPYFDVIKVNGSQSNGGFLSGMKRLFNVFFPSNISSLQSNTLTNEFGKQTNATDSLGQLIEADAMCDVMLVATSRDYIKSKMEVMDALEWSPASIEIKAMSILRYVQHAQMISMNNTFLVIDVNALTTDLNIYHGGNLELTRNVPIDFYETMTKSDGVENVWAVVQASQDALFQTHCNDLVYEVERLMSFYRYSLNHQQFEKFDHILLCGETPRLPDIMERLTKSLNMEVKLIPAQQLQGMENQTETFGSLAVAVGLALRGDAQ